MIDSFVSTFSGAFSPFYTQKNAYYIAYKYKRYAQKTADAFVHITDCEL